VEDGIGICFSILLPNLPRIRPRQACTLFPFRALFRAEEYTLALEMLRCVMRRRQVNRNFTKPGSRPIVFSANSFEQMIKTLNISPDEYRSSPELKEWVRQNKDHRYVPPELLEAFGFQVDAEGG
jgi:hypothetical protein